MRQRLLSPRSVSLAVAGGVSAFVVFSSALFCFSVMYSANASIEDGDDYEYDADDDGKDGSLMIMIMVMMMATFIVSLASGRSIAQVQ